METKSPKKQNWFTKLLSAKGEVSSKRVVSIVIIVNILVLAYVATFMGKILPEFMFDGLALISGGGMGLTVIEKIFNKGKNKDDDENS
jgi:hypothetical protein